MSKTKLTTVLLSLLAGSALGDVLPTVECPLLGPMFSPDFDIAETKSFEAAKAAFPKSIEAGLKATEKNLNWTGSVFGVDIYSAVTNKSIYSYFHTGDGAKDMITDELNDTTIFRIGSVSKIFTAYALLANKSLDILEEPVTKYLPELRGGPKDSISKLDWDAITVGALLSQQGGVGGVPYEWVSCFTTNNCSRSGFLKTMRDNRAPVTLPFGNPVYADSGFATLGQVLERVTGQSYNDAIQSVLSAPLGLKNSGTLKPKGNVNAAILKGSFVQSSWGFDNPVIFGTGGVYSSLHDLRALGISILNSELLDPISTRQWLKPRGSTSSLTQNVGAPWEIQRVALPVSPGSNRTRISDLYMKLGGNGGYGSIIGLSPDHQIGFSIVVGGWSALQQRLPLREFVGQAFMPAIEHAAWENAKKNFAGTFVTADGKYNVTLTVDEGHPGMGAKSALLGKTRSRLYPTGPTTHSKRGSTIISYRATSEPAYIPQSNLEGGTSMFDDGCDTWENLGFYGNSDNVDIEVVKGKAVSLTVFALGTPVVLKRAE